MVAEKIYKKVGKPKNYSPNPEEVEEAERRQAEELLKKQEKQMSELQEKEEAQSRAQRWDEWVCSWLSVSLINKVECVHHFA